MTLFEQVSNLKMPKKINDIYKSEEDVQIIESTLELIQNNQMSYFDFEIGKKSYSLCCALFDNQEEIIFWLEDDSEELKNIKINYKSNRINLCGEHWQNNLLNTIGAIGGKLENLSFSFVK
jgi:hypothetical protein